MPHLKDIPLQCYCSKTLHQISDLYNLENKILLSVNFYLFVYILFQSILMNHSLDPKNLKSEFIQIIGVDPNSCNLVSSWLQSIVFFVFVTDIFIFHSWQFHVFKSGTYSMFYWQTMGVGGCQFHQRKIWYFISRIRSRQDIESDKYCGLQL